MIAAMPGRPRNSDRQAIEAFARIHQGKAGTANGSRLFTGHKPGAHDHTDGLVGDDHLVANGSAHPEVAAAALAGVHEPPAGSAPLNGHEVDPASFGYLPPLPNLERPRVGRRVVVASTAAVVVILIALGIAGAASGPRRSHLSASSKTAATSRPSSATHRSSGSAGTGGAPAQSTTTTAGTGPISPTSTSAGSVQFLMAAGSGPLSVTIAAAGGSCWTEVAPSSGSSVSWAGTVADGSQHVLDPGSRWWLRLGAPEYATVTVNGRRLQLPATSSPLDVDIATS